MSSLLLKARVLGWPNLIVVHSQDAVTAVCLLQELHVKDSLCFLPMETKVEVGSKPIWKLSFCSFGQYSGSNDPSYMNHIVCGHYNANYGCGKCMNEVYTTRQPLSKHMKTCKGFPKEAVDMGTMENMDGVIASSSKDGAIASCSKDGATTLARKMKKHRSKDLLSDSQPPPQSSQTSPHHSKCTKKKSTATPQKSGSSSQSSSKKEKKCSSSHKYHGKGESSKGKHSKDKHRSKDKHCSKDKPSMDKLGKKIK